MSLHIHTLGPVGRLDNLIHVLHDDQTGQTAVVDPCDAVCVRRFLDDRAWTADIIFLTHHHHDHVAGVAELISAYSSQLVAAMADRHRMPMADRWVQDGDEIAFGDGVITVLETPGHTLHHVVYYWSHRAAPETAREEDTAYGHLFCGDTLFSLGCGRLFEGTPDQMWASLNRLRHLPPHTLVYPAHEYTLSNAAFALSQHPDDPRLLQRIETAKALRQAGHLTIPVRLDEECAVNPFLRNADCADPVGTFARLRQAKDVF
jgi:hydroxyacylglutathione hydrolase